MRENVTIFVERVDNLCRKILRFLYKNLMIFARKFNFFFKKICQVLQENLKILAEKFRQFLYGRLIIFTVKFDGICKKIWWFFQENLTILLILLPCTITYCILAWLGDYREPANIFFNAHWVGFMPLCINFEMNLVFIDYSISWLFNNRLVALVDYGLIYLLKYSINSHD